MTAANSNNIWYQLLLNHKPDWLTSVGAQSASQGARCQSCASLHATHRVQTGSATLEKKLDVRFYQRLLPRLGADRSHPQQTSAIPPLVLSRVEILREFCAAANSPFVRTSAINNSPSERPLHLVCVQSCVFWNVKHCFRIKLL